MGTIQDLNLTDDQASQIQSIQDKYFADLNAVQAAMLQAQSELRSLLWQKSPDKAAIDAKNQELQALRQKMADLASEMQEQIKSVLTEDQLAQFPQYGPMSRGGAGFGPGYGRGFGARGQNPAGVSFQARGL